MIAAPAWLACGPLCCPTREAEHTAQVAAGDRLPILPDRNRPTGSCSPLEGDGRPRADELKPDPQGSGFSFLRPESSRETARGERDSIQNLIMSLRVSVTCSVTIAGPPLYRCQPAYCSM